MAGVALVAARSTALLSHPLTGSAAAASFLLRQEPIKTLICLHVRKLCGLVGEEPVEEVIVFVGSCLSPRHSLLAIQLTFNVDEGSRRRFQSVVGGGQLGKLALGRAKT